MVEIIVPKHGLIVPRRSFLKGLGSLFVAPAIIPYSSLMPVKALEAIDQQIYDSMPFEIMHRGTPWRVVVRYYIEKDRENPPPWAIGYGA